MIKQMRKIALNIGFTQSRYSDLKNNSILYYTILFIIALLATSCDKGSSTPDPESSLVSNTLKQKFIQREEAAKILKTEDLVSKMWTPFDIAVRLQRQDGNRCTL